MKTVLSMVGIVALALCAAGVTWWVKGPPARGVVCPAAGLKPDEVCLERVLGEWGGDVIWVDARSRAEWQRETVKGALLWNLDEGEDMLAFEAAVAPSLVDGGRVVVFCTSEACGTSRQVAERIRNLGLGNEVHVLYGGWLAFQGPAGGKVLRAPGS